MTEFDYAMLGVVFVSLLISIWRGLIREVVSILSWLVALWVAAHFSVALAAWMPAAMTNPSVRYLSAFAGLFLLTVIALELIGVLLAKLLRAAGLGFIDRLLGSIFGLARGALIALILTLLGGLTPLPQRDWWRDSLLAPPLQAAVLAARPLLPIELAKRIKYS
ncbi:MAG: CvpA family protein [Casimicrobiaceae bacterium]